MSVTAEISAYRERINSGMEKRSSRGPSSICVEKAINPECLPGSDIRVARIGYPCRQCRVSWLQAANDRSQAWASHAGANREGPKTTNLAIAPSHRQGRVWGITRRRCRSNPLAGKRRESPPNRVASMICTRKPVKSPANHAHPNRATTLHPTTPQSHSAARSNRRFSRSTYPLTA